MAGKILSAVPTMDPTASVRESELGAYTEVGARTILLDVTMGDYSYVVNDAQITYTAIGKFCSIAAMTRINPGCPYQPEKTLLPQGFLHLTSRSETGRPQALPTACRTR